MASPPTAPRPAGGPGHPAYGLLHADAVRLLRAHQPADAQQELVRLDMLAHLAAHPDAMAKAGPPAHFTASCLVLDPSLERVLLTHHRKADQWFQFGGHLEPGDRSVRAGAEREALEESGVEGLQVTPFAVHLDRHALVGSFGRCTEHLDIRYAALAPRGARPAVSEESLDVRWWPVDALPGDGGLARPVARARQALAGIARRDSRVPEAGPPGPWAAGALGRWGLGPLGPWAAGPRIQKS